MFLFFFSKQRHESTFLDPLFLPPCLIYFIIYLVVAAAAVVEVVLVVAAVVWVAVASVVVVVAAAAVAVVAVVGSFVLLPANSRPPCLSLGPGPPPPFLLVSDSFVAPLPSAPPSPRVWHQQYVEQAA